MEIHPNPSLGDADKIEAKDRLATYVLGYSPHVTQLEAEKVRMHIHAYTDSFTLRKQTSFYISTHMPPSTPLYVS
jgi:hypothetical protein